MVKIKWNYFLGKKGNYLGGRRPARLGVNWMWQMRAGDEWRYSRFLAWTTKWTVMPCTWSRSRLGQGSFEAMSLGCKHGWKTHISEYHQSFIQWLYIGHLLCVLGGKDIDVNKTERNACPPPHPPPSLILVRYTENKQKNTSYEGIQKLNLNARKKYTVMMVLKASQSISHAVWEGTGLISQDHDLLQYSLINTL